MRIINSQTLNEWAALQDPVATGLMLAVQIPHADFMLLMKEYTPCYRSKERARRGFEKALETGIATIATPVGLVCISCLDFPQKS